MKCKNCGENLMAGGFPKWGWIHANGAEYCNFDVAEPVPELTPAGLDLDLIGKRLPALEQEEAEPSMRAAAALYRTVLRLAEKVGLE